jgi:hypothetical protein
MAGARTVVRALARHRYGESTGTDENRSRTRRDQRPELPASALRGDERLEVGPHHPALVGGAAGGQPYPVARTMITELVRHRLDHLGRDRRPVERGAPFVLQLASDLARPPAGHSRLFHTADITEARPIVRPDRQDQPIGATIDVNPISAHTRSTSAVGYGVLRLSPNRLQ